MSAEVVVAKIRFFGIESQPTRVQPSGTAAVAYAQFELAGAIVVHDVRVMTGPDGLWLSMPNRKTSDRCRSCNHRTPFVENYCGACGRKLMPDRLPPLQRDGKPRYYCDVVHPANPAARESLEHVVLTRFAEEYPEFLGDLERRGRRVAC